MNHYPFATELPSPSALQSLIQTTQSNPQALENDTMQLKSTNIDQTIGFNKYGGKLMCEVTIQSYLKEKYMQKSLPKFVDEDDDDIPELTVDGSYVNLVIVKQDEQKDKEDKLRNEFTDTSFHDYKDIYTAKETIKLEDIFNSTDIDTTKEAIGLGPLFDLINNPTNRSNCRVRGLRKILIYGRAGIGKTTLVHKIAHNWARINDPLWKGNFDYVFWIPLRDLETSSTWERVITGDVEPLIKALCYCCLGKRNCAANLKDVLKSSDRILYLLDGYDEIGHSHQTMVKDLIDLLLDSLDAYVIMTSRPNAVDSRLERKFDQCLENIGLDSEGIGRYIDTYFNNAETHTLKISLQQFIKTRTLIQGLIRIPINLFLLCYSWKTSRDVDSINGDAITLSYLYTQVVGSLMRKYCNKFRHTDTIHMNQKRVDQVCKIEYIMLEELAFAAMRDHKIIIDKQIMEHSMEKNSQYDALNDLSQKIGLLKAIGDGKKVRDKDHYFVHLTFQEYFAGRHMARCLGSSDDSQLQQATDFLKRYKYTPAFERLILFTAGNLNNESQQSRSQFWRIILNENIDLTLTNQVLLIIRCMEEADTDKIPHKDKLLKYITKIIDTCVYDLSHRMFDKIIKVMSLCPRVADLTEISALLIEILSKSNVGEVKDRLIWALGELRRSSQLVTQTLITVMINNNDHSPVSSAVVESLYKHGQIWPNAVNKLIECMHSNNEALKTPNIYSAIILCKLDRLPLDSINILVKGLQHEDRTVRYDVIKVVNKAKYLSPEMIYMLIRCLEEDDELVRVSAVTALSKSELLIEEIFEALMFSLSNIGYVSSSKIRAPSQSSHSRRRDTTADNIIFEINIIKALGGIKDLTDWMARRLVHGLIQSLRRSGYTLIEKYVTETLGQIAKSFENMIHEEIDAIITNLKETNARFRVSITTTWGEFERLYEQNSGTLMSLWSKFEDLFRKNSQNPSSLRDNIANWDKIGTSSPEILDEFRSTIGWEITAELQDLVLNRTNWSLEQVSLLCLNILNQNISVIRIIIGLVRSQSKIASIATKLANILTDDGNGVIRFYVLLAFSSVEEPPESIVDTLIDIAKKSPYTISLIDELINSIIRRLAITVLGTLGRFNQKSVIVLAEILESDIESFDDRNNAVEALGVSGSRSEHAIQVLRRNLINETFKTNIAVQLGKLGQSSGDITNLLVTGLKHITTDKDILMALGELGKSSTIAKDALIGLMAKRKMNIHLALALGRLGDSDEKIIESLCDEFKDTYSAEETRTSCISTVVKLKPSYQTISKIVCALCFVLDDESSVVRKSAREGLNWLAQSPENADALLGSLTTALKDDKNRRVNRVVRDIITSYPTMTDQFLALLVNDTTFNHEKRIRIVKDIPILNLCQSMIQHQGKNYLELMIDVIYENGVGVTITKSSMVLESNIPTELLNINNQEQRCTKEIIVLGLYGRISSAGLPTVFLDSIIEHKEHFFFSNVKYMSDMTFTAVVLCAKYEEARAFRLVLKDQGAAETSKAMGSLLYHILIIQDIDNKPFEIQVYCPRDEPGAVMAAADVTSIIGQLSPHWVFMTGICAANPLKAAVGDVMVAKRVVDYWYGKRDRNGTHHDIRPLAIDEYLSTAIMETADSLKGSWDRFVKRSRPVSRRYQKDAVSRVLYDKYSTGMYIPEIMSVIPEVFESKEDCFRVLESLTVSSPPQIICSQDGKYSLDLLRYEELTKLIRVRTFPTPDAKEPKVHNGTLLTDVSAVVADLDEEKWSQYENEIGARDLYGLEMEGIGLYESMEVINRNRSEKIKFMLVKGVSDYASDEKDDKFHEYGKQVSAAFVYQLLRLYGYKLIHNVMPK